MLLTPAALANRLAEAAAIVRTESRKAVAKRDALARRLAGLAFACLAAEWLAPVVASAIFPRSSSPKAWPILAGHTQGPDFRDLSPFAGVPV